MALFVGACAIFLVGRVAALFAYSDVDVSAERWIYLFNDFSYGSLT